MVVVAAVEGGGTFFCVAVAECSKNETAEIPKILHRANIDSSHDNPQLTLQECADFLEQHKPPEGYHALGIANFGPLGVKESDPQRYGRILDSSPKQQWRNVDLLTPLRKACQGSSRPLAVRVETDVNAPALAEYHAIRREIPTITSCCYVTVGTGVGTGLVIHGKPVHGRMHPEGGHVSVQPLPGDPFEGYSWGQKSPFQGRQTVEGLACSVALTERLEQRTKQKAVSRSVLADLRDDDPIWDHAANALANLCVTLLLTTSMEKIVLGGGVMKRKILFDKVRRQTRVLLNGYLELPEDMSELILESAYGDDAGLTGALVLAQRAYLEAGASKPRDGDNKNKSLYYSGLAHGIIVMGAAAFFYMSMRRRA